MTFGNFYFGKDGFFYKKNQNVGVKRNPNASLSCSPPQNIYNRYG